MHCAEVCGIRHSLWVFFRGFFLLFILKIKLYCIDQNILWYKFWPYRRALKILSSCIHLHLPSKPMYDFQYMNNNNFFLGEPSFFLGLFQSNSTVSCTLPKLGNKSSVCDLIIHRPWPNKTTIPAVAELGAVGMGQSEQFRPERGSWPPEAPLKEVLWTVWGV